MNAKKALFLFLINTLLLGGLTDIMNIKFPATIPSPSSLVGTPDPKPTVTPAETAAPTPEEAGPPEPTETPEPTATPEPTETPIPTATPKPTATPVPTKVPLGKKKVQSKKPGDLIFNYPETAELNTDPATYTLLVNKEYPIASSYIPYMVEPDVEIYHKGINERRYLQPIASTALEELFAAAEEDGLHLVLRCGFRSYKLQKSIYTWNLKSYGYYEASRYHALPGTSEHQTGLAVDLCCEATDYQNNLDILTTEEYAWLLENAHLYGWILRYPEDKTDITGYNFEPWHFRYVGVELATYLKEHNLVLEEYYGALPTTNLLAIPEEYHSYLSEEDYALMMEEIEAFEKKQKEQENLPTPTPEPDFTPTPTPDSEEDDVTPTPDILPEDSDSTPTPDVLPEDTDPMMPLPEEIDPATPTPEEMPEDTDPIVPTPEDTEPTPENEDPMNPWRDPEEDFFIPFFPTFR